jgi:hypothetical protein
VTGAGEAGDVRATSRVFWPFAIVGWAVMAFAVAGALGHRRLTNPLAAAKLVVGLDLAHDLVVAPLALLVGALVVRLVPTSWRAAAKVGLAASAIVSLYAFPLVRGYGRTRSAGPSRLPGNYATGLADVLVVVWVALVIVVAVSARRSRRPRRR